MATNTDDCYFYYYSSCTKGDTCPFRHEPSARGTEEMCEEWAHGKCVDESCSLRHMQINVQRNNIQCYWEKQPSGCQKPHCMFRHNKSRHHNTVSNTGSAGVRANSKLGLDTSPQVPSPKVEQILIHIEDTDNEDSPQKPAMRIKPVVCRETLITKINLNSTQKTNEAEVNKYTKLSNSNNLQIMKKGIRAALDSTLSSNVDKSSAPVQKKSLKELKREKILKARLEYEKKKLLAAQENNYTQPESTVNREKQATDNHHPQSEHPQSVVVKKSGVTIIKPVLAKKRQLYKKTEPGNSSPIKEQDKTSPVSQQCGALSMSHQKAEPMKSQIKIKTLEEIQNEKRQRSLAANDSNAKSQISEQVQTKVVENKPTIAPRRIKLKPNKPVAVINKSPVKLKRTSALLDDSDIPTKKPANETKSALSELSNGAPTRDECTTETNNEVKTHKTEALQATDHLVPTEKISSIEDSSKDSTRLSKSEFDLLDSSALFSEHENGDSSALDIDDEELMNEMEELLA